MKVLHDLRSPLLAVENIAGRFATSIPLLHEKRELADEHKSILADLEVHSRILHQCGDLMEGIVSDMCAQPCPEPPPTARLTRCCPRVRLDFERIDSGRLQIVFSQLSIRELLSQATSTFQCLATAKGLALNVGKIPEELDWLLFEGDFRRLLQCLNNGVSNAIKFTDKGSITINVEVGGPHARADEGFMWVVLSVRDTGMGMSEEEIRALSSGDLFTQVGQGQLQGAGGTGIGLAIVREMLHLHGGSTLELSSAGKDCGTTFCMRLSLKVAAAAPAAALPGAVDPASMSTPRSGVAAPAAATAKQQVRCLYVEDDVFLAETFPLVTFRLMGVAYDHVADGQAAVDTVAADLKRYDLIVIDNQVPAPPVLPRSRGCAARSSRCPNLPSYGFLRCPGSTAPRRLGGCELWATAVSSSA